MSGIQLLIVTKIKIAKNVSHLNESNYTFLLSNKKSLNKKKSQYCEEVNSA